MAKAQYKVLTVEDDPPVLNALKDKLTRAGFAVVEARDGAQGLEQVKKEKPDIILLDIRMPKMDGIAMLKKLREELWGKDVPVIVLTVSSDMSQVEMATQFDVFDYLIKTDWSIEDVVKKVKEKLAEVEAKKAKK